MLTNIDILFCRRKEPGINVVLFAELVDGVRVHELFLGTGRGHIALVGQHNDRHVDCVAGTGAHLLTHIAHPLQDAVTTVGLCSQTRILHAPKKAMLNQRQVRKD